MPAVLRDLAERTCLSLLHLLLVAHTVRHRVVLLILHRLRLLLRRCRSLELRLLTHLHLRLPKILRWLVLYWRRLKLSLLLNRCGRLVLRLLLDRGSLNRLRLILRLLLYRWGLKLGLNLLLTIRLETLSYLALKNTGPRSPNCL